MRKLKSTLTQVFSHPAFSQVLAKSPEYIFIILVGLVPLLPMVTLSQNTNVFAALLVSILALIAGVEYLRNSHTKRTLEPLTSILVLLGLLAGVVVLTELSLPSLTGFGFVSSTYVFYVALGIAIAAGYLLSSATLTLKKVLLYGAVSIGVFGAIRIFLSVGDLTSIISQSETAFSSFLLFGVGLILASALNLSSLLSNLEHRILLVVQAITAFHLFFSGSRELMLSTGLILFVVFVVQLLKDWQVLYEVRGIFIGVLAVALVGVGGFNISLGNSFTQELVQPPSQEVRPAFSATTYVLFEQWRGDSSSLIIGSGLSNFSETWSRYMPVAVSTSDYWDDDFTVGSNLFITSLLEVGLPISLVFFLTLLLLPFWLLLHPRRAMSWDISVLGLVGAVLFGIYWVFSYTPQTFFILTIGVLGGLVLREIIINEKSEGLQSRLERTQLWILLVISIVLFITALIHGTALHLHHQSSKFLDGSVVHYVKATEKLETSATLAGLPETHRTLATLYLASTQRDLGSEITDTTNEGILIGVDKAINHADKARLSDSGNYRTHLIFGEAQLESGILRRDGEILKGAVESFNNAQSRAPNRIEPLFALARAAVALQAQDQARAYTLQILELQPGHEQARKLLEFIEQE